MKKTMITMLLLAVIMLPATSWQVYNRNIDLLKVYRTDNMEDGICFEGKAEDYDGTCVSPSAPTGEWVSKQYTTKN